MYRFVPDTTKTVRALGTDLLARFFRDESGGYLVLAGLALPAALGMVSLGTEAGLWYYKHQAMQGAADSGAVSAAVDYYLESNGSVLQLQAESAIATYCFVNGSNGVTVTVNRPPQSGNYTTAAGAVEVIITQPQARLLSAMWHAQPISISARAVARGTGGKGCVLALDRSASGAVTLQGNAQVTLTGCSLFDDSNNTSALTVGGTSRLSAYSTYVVGGCGTSTCSSISNISVTNGIETGTTPMADPYAGTASGSYSGCAQHNFSAKSAVTIDPGVYCGGMALNAGANVTLNPASITSIRAISK